METQNGELKSRKGVETQNGELKSRRGWKRKKV